MTTNSIEWLRRSGPTRWFAEGLQELREIAALVEASGYGHDRIRVDPSVVRGLEYYTGPVFEAELTFETPGEDGKPVRFGSVGGGGRYDGLVARFRAEPVPATGFSIGVSRLLAALRAIKSPIVAAADAPGPVVVLALDRDEQSMANYSAPRRALARRRHRRRALSRRGRHERAAQIRRQAREPLRRHPGLERARRARRPAGDDPRSQTRRRTREGRPRTARIIWSFASARSSRRPRPSSSSACARSWRRKSRPCSMPSWRSEVKRPIEHADGAASLALLSSWRRRRGGLSWRASG